MAVSHQNSEGLARGARMLRTALGPASARFLEDVAVVEVMLNPDGRIWIDRLSEGLSDTGERLAPADGERIVRLVAHHISAEVHAGAPRVGALVTVLDRFLVDPGQFSILWSSGQPMSSRLRAFIDFVGERLFVEPARWGRSYS